MWGRLSVVAQSVGLAEARNECNHVIFKTEY
jgi:hypothetical protein